MGQTHTRQSEEGETLKLAAFTAELSYDDLTEAAVESARKAFVDTLASAYAGISTDPGERIIEYVTKYDKAETTVIGSNQGSHTQYAALANGTLAHALDVDDGHRSAAGHPGSAVVPAALAVAERHEATGEELVTAIIAGYEGMVTTAKSVQTSHRERGFHGTATCGCIGAAAAVSSLLDLDTTQTAHALGLGGTQAGGLFEFLEKGSMSKRFHPGRAALAGILAGELAVTGFDGPDTIIEGTDGFAEAFADEYDLSHFQTLGEPYAVTENYLKPFPCCRHIHGPIEAAQMIRSKGVSTENIASIQVETYDAAAHHDKTDVRNLLDAQMSIPYGVAIAFITGEAKLDQFDPSNLERPEVRKLLEKVSVSGTEDMESIYPKTRPVRLTTTLNSGDIYEEIVKYPLGAAERPLSREQIEEKFYDITDGFLPQARQETILENAFAITEYDSVASFTDTL